MLVFTLAISFDNFQFALIHGPNIPDSYAILLFTASDLASITSHITTEHCFCFGSLSSFFLELFLHWSPVAYWAPTNLGSSSFSVLSFCLFILFMGFSRQEYWSGLPFPSPVDHILWELFTMAHLSWVGPWKESAHHLNCSQVSLLQRPFTFWCLPASMPCLPRGLPSLLLGSKEGEEAPYSEVMGSSILGPCLDSLGFSKTNAKL